MGLEEKSKKEVVLARDYEEEIYGNVAPKEWAAIKNHSEINFLDYVHMDSLGKPLSQNYIDYMLDKYNLYRSSGESVNFSKCMALLNTETKIYDDASLMLSENLEKLKRDLNDGS
jgi:hypothetical protein